MRHVVCEITKTGDYILTTPDGKVIENGTCKEDAADGKVTINPNVAWTALNRRYDGNR